MVQPCTLSLLISAFIFVLAAGSHAPMVAVAHTVGAAVVAWMRFGRIWSIDIEGGAAIAAGIMVALAAVALWSMKDGPAWHSTTPAAIAGGVAAAVWQPCVGARLADIVNDAPHDRLATIPTVSAYVAGVSAIPLALAAVIAFAGPAKTLISRRPVALVGAGLGVALGVLLAIGKWGEFVSELTRRTLS